MLYLDDKNRYWFLVLKRVPEDGGYWQAITGTIEKGELPIENLKQKLLEEAGIGEALLRT